ncbi:MAG: hypothetical protein WCT20_00425 [Candidatus Babeliales bacterium]|jgi:hypothetical protein
MSKILVNSVALAAGLLLGSGHRLAAEPQIKNDEQKKTGLIRTINKDKKKQRPGIGDARMRHRELMEKDRLKKPQSRWKQLAAKRKNRKSFKKNKTSTTQTSSSTPAPISTPMK